MQPRAMDVPLGHVRFDTDRFPDRTAADYDLADLINFYHLNGTIPPVHANLENGSAVVVANHRFLTVARALDRPTVRVIFRREDRPGALDAFLADNAGVSEVDIAAVLRAEREQPVYNQWHYYVFERPLSDEAKADFERMIRSFFAERRSPLAADVFTVDGFSFGQDARSAWFRVRVVDGEDTWFGEYFRAQVNFSRTVAEIGTFNGQRLPS